jgi:hypothetical protein
MCTEGIFFLRPDIDFKAAVHIDPDQPDIGALEPVGVSHSGFLAGIVEDKERKRCEAPVPEGLGEARRQSDSFISKDLAKESGIETPTREQLAKLDRKRKKKGNNDDWKNARSRCA